ncbi:hypothetical protein DFH09DRAFT_1093702 [Mycena vulgaris]|nr:hypothetical protein DFH09DRAFT_1093702 [Mycena vulgaris]
MCLSDFARNGDPEALTIFLSKTVAWPTSKGALNPVYAVVALSSCEVRQPRAWVPKKDGIKVQKKVWDEMVEVWKGFLYRHAELDNGELNNSPPQEPQSCTADMFSRQRRDLEDASKFNNGNANHTCKKSMGKVGTFSRWGRLDFAGVSLATAVGNWRKAELFSQEDC